MFSFATEQGCPWLRAVWGLAVLAPSLGKGKHWCKLFFFCVPCCGHLWLCGHICLCLLNTTLSNGAALASALRQHLSLFISVMISALQDRAHSLQDSWKRGEVRVCFPPRASSPHVCLLVCLRVPALVKDL